jgi:hypothetical protein
MKMPRDALCPMQRTNEPLDVRPTNAASCCSFTAASCGSLTIRKTRRTLSTVARGVEPEWLHAGELGWEVAIPPIGIP